MRWFAKRVPRLPSAAHGRVAAPIPSASARVCVGSARLAASAGGRDAYPDIHTKAAALFHSVVSNHAFVDGNKRTGVLAVVVYYGFNGYLFDADDADLIHLAVDVAISNLDVAAITEHFTKWARPLPDPAG